jgi:hypothetical protein
MIENRVKCLSIRQPWAWAILHAGKDIENRPARIAKMALDLVGQRIYIHAGRTLDPSALDFMPDIKWPDEYDVGGIVGSVEIAGTTIIKESPWFTGPYGIILTKPRVEPFKPVRGQLGFFWVEN